MTSTFSPIPDPEASLTRIAMRSGGGDDQPAEAIDQTHGIT